MLISVVNHTNGLLNDEAVQVAVRAVNRQIALDFEPYWHIGARLRLEGRATKTRPSLSLPELRGDAIIYLWDNIDVEGAAGYHEKTARGIPYGIVYVEISDALEEPWTVTFSHEALELVGDPEVNLLVAGPHPGDRRRRVFHWFEMCDAVQAEHYFIDDVPLSNFVLPLYFTREAEVGGRNDFLGRTSAPDQEALASFGINPGGYIGFFNPQSRCHETFALKDDAVARKRLEIKGRAQRTRRSVRYASGRPAAAEPAPRALRASSREVEMINQSEDRPGPGD